MIVLKVEKHKSYRLYTTNTISKLYRQIKASCDELEIGVQPKEIGSHSKLRADVLSLTEKDILEIEVRDILFTIVKATKIPMLYQYMEKNIRKEKTVKSQIKEGGIL